MILDANILIYAYDSSNIHHVVAKAWLEKIITDQNYDIILPDLTINAFIRITTNPRVMQFPLTVKESTSIIDELISNPLIRNVGVTISTWKMFTQLTQTLSLTSSLVTDSIIAATALSMSMPIITNDNDFYLYPQLRVINPLVQSSDL